MDIQASNIAFIAIVVFIASFVVFIVGFQGYSSYVDYRIDQGQNITAEETDRVLSAFKKAPVGLIIGYSAVITGITVWILSKNKRSTSKNTEKFKYR